VNQSCGCCAGTERLTPAVTANPPGLDALHYRVGTHGSFLETMLARLSSLRIDSTSSLAGLKVRTGDDPSIALLDAWATVADVLTFYTERIANEGYLRTATERSSILELARLVGYRLRPGLAASTYVAYLLDVVPGQDTTVTIPAASRIQSVPGPGELPQSFETAEGLYAQASWNMLRPRLTRPVIPAHGMKTLYAAGISTQLNPNDRVLLGIPGELTPDVRRAASVIADPAENRTAVTLQPVEPQRSGHKLPAGPHGPGTAVLALGKLIGPLAQPPSRPPTSARQLDRDPAALFALGSDLGPQLLSVLNPAIRGTVYQAWAGATLTAQPPPDRLLAQRLRAVPFGATAPLKPILNDNGAVIGTEEWPLSGLGTIRARVTYLRGVPVSVTADLTGGVSSATATVPTPLPADQTYQLGSLGSVRVQNATDKNTGAGTLTLTFSGSISRTMTIGVPPIVIGIAPAAAPVSVGSGPLPVVFDDQPDTVWSPEPGQTLHSTVGTHRITIGLSDRPRTLDVSYQALLPSQNPKVLPLDAVYDRIQPDTWAVIERGGDDDPLAAWITKVETVSHAAYNITATVTELTLDRDWLTGDDVLLSAIRKVSVYAQSERLDLVPEPRDDPVKGDVIELDALYGGLPTGRFLIVSGERTDIPATAGVQGTELVMLVGAEQLVDLDLPGDTVHTTIRLAKPLKYEYKRDTVRIFGNIVKATHGESSSEVLGSGDGSKPGQAFTLRRSPLTYLAAVTPTGAQSTLEVRVDGLLWREADTLAFAGPVDHVYTTQSDDQDTTTAIFGDGARGARLPTGAENVRAAYRIGIGGPGNVRAGQITQLQTRPLGVNGVMNPLPATGGADRDTLDQARRNVPLAVLALDRLVSVPDYADFARARAGIGRASAARLSDGTNTVVHLTVAGTDDIPIDETDDLFQSLRQSLSAFGDASQPVQVAVRELLLIVMAAAVHVDADHRFDLLEPQIRAALLDRFGFGHRDLGQVVFQSELIATIQAVPGVDRVGIDALGVAPAGLTPAQLQAFADGLAPPAPQLIPVELARPDPQGHGILPAQLALLSPLLPDTLILKER
jgi:predicted phage baseplate assembly protein